jgi:hypothetical protein
MLKLNIQPVEFFDETSGEFKTHPGLKLTIEHSLYTISKWESRWMKPYLSNKEMSDEELLDYILCMDNTNTLTMDILQTMQQTDLNRIIAYINSNMTATTFNNNGDNGKSREIITSELIYYWMIALQIPLECEHWHLNRLMTLIRICNIKNSPPKKQNRQTMLANQRELNKQRKMQNNSTG